MTRNTIEASKLAELFILGKQGAFDPQTQTEIYNTCFEYIGLESRYSLVDGGRWEVRYPEKMAPETRDKELSILSKFTSEMKQAFLDGIEFEQEVAAVRGILNRYQK